MKRNFLLIISVAALLLFIGVQIYMIGNVWKQKEEQITLRYKMLSREALSTLLVKKKINGFEKPMIIIDDFSAIVKEKELPICMTRKDTLELKTHLLKEVNSIINKNEFLSTFTKYFIAKEGYDTVFNTVTKVNIYEIIPSGKLLKIKRDFEHKKSSSTILVNSFREERNNFIIQYDYYLDLTHKNETILRETLLSLSLIIFSIIIVVLIFWFTWRNLMEEKRLSELKTDFINNMTHELKTPLSTICVAGRTLEKEQIRKDDSKILETAHLIGKQSVHLNQLINSILDVSILERTEFEMDKKEVKIDELLHEMAEAFLTSCNYCATIRENYNCNGSTAKIDILYFTTMINNILSNAVKYCAPNPTIDIVSETTDKIITISITDNGPGISKEHIDHIFDKFYRVPQGNLHNVKGLGLGLYYVRRIVQAHNGEVKATSKPGRGTTFIITIPTK
jgi:signal transduction histidine kinase